MERTVRGAALLITAAVLVSSLTACSGGGASSGAVSPGGSSAASTASAATDYPTKNVGVVVPYGAGGTTDLATRGLLQAVDQVNGKKATFVVSNVAGGSGLIGTNQFVNSPKDGYVLGILNCDLVLNNVLGKTDITYDQFVPLALIQADPYGVFVKSSNGKYSNFQEFVEYAKAHPDEVKMADTGSGTANSLAINAMEEKLGLKFKKISYDSAADSVVAVVSGEVDATVCHSSPATGQLEAGKISMLAVTSNERLSTYPDVPAVGELYSECKDMKVLSWICVAALKGTDDAVVGALADSLSKASVSPAFQKTQEGFHMQKITMTSQSDIEAFIKDQDAYYREVLGK